MNRKQQISILKQIQRFIALEAVSPTVMELYFDKQPPIYRILAYYTNIPNEQCMDVPEKYDHHIKAFPNTSIKRLSSHTTHYIAKDFILNQKFNDFILN